MSSWRTPNRGNSRVHKERSQPSERSHLGELEKKKDYKLRSQDYQKKRDALHELHKRALEKNPNEFYFHMVNSQTKDGIHFDVPSKKQSRANAADTAAQQKLLESRDIRYVQFKLHTERKKIEKLQASLHMVDKQNHVQPNKHTIFVDSKEEAKSFDAAEYFDTHPSLLGRTANRTKLDILQKADLSDAAYTKSDFVKTARERKKMYDELLKRLDREKELRVTLNKLQLRKNLTATNNKQKPKRIKKGSANRAAVYRWEYERQR